MALSRDQVIRAAIDLCDDNGFASLSMRALGRSLGVEAMSLYRYVESREDLLAAMHERLLGTLPPPPRDDGWEIVLLHQAGALRDLLAAHPALVPLFASRAAATPRAVQRVDEILAVLARAGFPEDEAEHAFQLVFEYVIGHAAFHLAVPSEPRAAVERFGWGLETIRLGLAARLYDVTPARRRR